MKLLVANRGEIAVRVLRAAAELGHATVAVASEDDAASPHLDHADERSILPGKGPAAYLDADALLDAAAARGAGWLHPGYGFLSESASFAAACAERGVVFVGPSPETLRALGDKAAARGRAEALGIPVLEGATSLDGAARLLEAAGPGGALMVKAVAGGGGRGMRRVASRAELDLAWERCASEAAAAFGDPTLYAERFLAGARHVEVQVLGDAAGALRHLGERECSLQRRHQKIVEIAPCPSLSEALRGALIGAALRLAADVGLHGLATFEFLVEASGEPGFRFLEANPRLQVEHTVSEMVTGVDLVQTQLQLARGASLEALGLAPEVAVPARGFALQARINLEQLGPEGELRPSGGTLSTYEPPTGPGLRVDGYARAGTTTNPRFDSLLAKLVAWAPTFDGVVRRARRALGEFRIEGVATNLPLLEALLALPEIEANRVSTQFLEERLPELAAGLLARAGGAGSQGALATAPAHAGVRLASDDPLAVLDHGKGAGALAPASGSAGPAAEARVHAPPSAPPGTEAVAAPLQGTIVSVHVEAGAAVHAGQALVVMEAMKMEHVIAAPHSGWVRQLAVAVGDTVFEGHPLVFLEEAEVEASANAAEAAIDPDRIRPDLEEVRQRHALGHDAARPEAVAA